MVMVATAHPHSRWSYCPDAFLQRMSQAHLYAAGTEHGEGLAQQTLVELNLIVVTSFALMLQIHLVSVGGTEGNCRKEADRTSQLAAVVTECGLSVKSRDARWKSMGSPASR